MTKGMLLLALIFSPETGNAQEQKAFVKWPAAKEKAKKEIQVSQSCFLQKHLPQHIDFVLEKILPRMELEANFFTKPQVYDKKTFYVADGLNYRDLYHGHLRYQAIKEMGSMEDYVNPETYHIQYHSFEHLDKMKLGWLRELVPLLTDPLHADWVSKNLKKTEDTSSGSSAFGGYAQENKTPVLEKSELKRIAQIWHEALGSDSQGIDRLMLRLKMINDPVKDSDAIAELMFFRSIASFNHAFGIINPGLDLADHWQPLDIFFESITRHPQIADEIRAFKDRTGMSWVGNPTSRDGNFLGLSGATAKDAQSTFDRIIRLAKEDPNPESVFKNTADQPIFVTLFTLSGGHVFQFRYNMSTYCR